MTQNEFSPLPLSNFLTNGPRGPARKDESHEESFLPRLVIFGGGTGYEIGWRFYRAMRTRHPEALGDHVQMLTIDTTRQEERRGVEPLPAGSFIYLPPFNAADLIKHLSENPYVSAFWPGWPDNPFDPTTHGSGTQRVRANARLYFYYYLSGVIMPAIREMINRAVRVKTGQVVTAGLRVDIYGSIAGGTLSGMLLDLAYCVRLAAREKLDNVLITANLVLDEAFKARSNPLLTDTEMSANAMATLLDINRLYMTRNFRVRYNPLTTTENFVHNNRPFDFVYLVGLTNEIGKNLANYEDLVEMVSLKLETEVLSQGKNHLANVYDNIRGNQQTVGEQPTAYSSFAVGQMRYPLVGVTSHCALTGLESLVKALISSSLRSHTLVENDTLAFLQAAQVDTEQARHLLDRLNTNTRGEPLSPPAVLHEQVREVPEERLPGLLQSVEDDGIRQQAALRESIAANQPAIVQGFEQCLNDEVNRMIRDARYGPRYTCWFLQNLAARVENQRDRSAEERSLRYADLTSQEAMWRGAREAVEKAMRMPGLHPLRKKRLGNARNDFAVAFNAYHSSAHQHELQSRTMDVLGQLAGITQGLFKQASDLVKTCEQTGQNARDRAGSELSRLQATHTDYTLIKNVIAPDGLRRAFEQHFPSLDSQEQITSLAGDFWAFFDRHVPGWRLGQEGREAEDHPAVQLYAFLAGHYAERLRSKTLLEMLKETYGERWKQEVRDYFDMIRPFWAIIRTRFSADLQSIYQAEPNLIVYGEQNEDWQDLMREIFGENVHMVTGGDIHTLTILRTAHGIPLFALRGIEMMKERYDYIQGLWKRRVHKSGAIPLDILPNDGHLFDYEPRMPYSADEKQTHSPTKIIGNTDLPANGKSVAAAGEPVNDNH